MIFPVNIKPHTLPRFLAEQELYNVINGWMLIDVLQQIPREMLDRVDVAWYGEHEESGVIPPYFCPQCRESTIAGLKRYNAEDSWRERQNILNHFWEQKCSCYDEKKGEEGSFFGTYRQGIFADREQTFE